jgi:hypothetical protein
MAETRSAGDVIEINPAEYTLEELRAIVAGQPGRLPPVLALAALRRKEYPEAEKVADLRRVLLDGAAEPRLRTAAALELGRLGSPAARLALAELTGRPGALLSRAVQLGQRELARMHGAAAPEPEAAEAPAAALARPLRPELAAALSRPAGPPLPLHHDRAEPVVARKARIAQANRIAADLREETPELALAPEPTYRLHCGTRTLAVVGTPVMAALVEGQAVERPVLVAVVAGEDTVESKKWGARYFLVAGPGEKGGELALRVVTGRGRTVMAGELLQGEGELRFALRSVAGPGNNPAEMSGRYGGGRLRLDQALAEKRIAEKLTPGRRAR